MFFTLPVAIPAAEVAVSLVESSPTTGTPAAGGSVAEGSVHGTSPAGAPAAEGTSAEGQAQGTRAAEGSAQGTGAARSYPPGQVIVRPVIVSYDGPGPAEFSADVRLPEGWRLLSGREVLSFEGAGTELLLVSFFPPADTLAGSYTATLVLEDVARLGTSGPGGSGDGTPVGSGRGARGNGAGGSGYGPGAIGTADSGGIASAADSDAVIAALDLPVEILPVKKIECRLLEQPDYILSGEAYRVVFACSNRGNVPLKTIVKAASSSGFDIRTEAPSLAMLPGETVRLAVVADTPINLYTQIKHILSLELRAVEDPSVKAGAASTVDVIPRTMGRESRYNTIPGQVSTLGVLQHGETDVFGLEAGVSGQGFLDEEKETFLQFRFKEVPAGAGILIPDREDYLVRVDGREYSAGIGTQYYSLSPLTEASVYGTGVSLSKKLGPLSVSGFAMDGLLDGLDESRYASRLTWDFGDRGRAAVNLLEAEEEDRWTSGSLQGHFLLPTGDRIEGEYAFSSGEWIDEAYFFSTGGATDIFSYSLKYLYAGPRYRGSLEDQEQLLASVAYSPVRDIRFRVSAGTKKYELDRKFPGTVDFSRFGFSWTGVPNVLLTADLQQTLETERDSDPAAETAVTEGKSLRLGLLRDLGPVDFRLAYEYGDNFSLTEAERSFSEHLTAQFDVRTGTLGDLQAFLGRHFRDFTSTKTPYTEFGFLWQRELSSRADLSAEYRTVNSNQSFYEGADQLILGLNFFFPNQSHLTVTAEYGPDRSSGSKEDLTVSVGYSAPFSIPVSLKKNIGRVEGKVVDALTGQAVPEVILRMGSSVAVSDTFGKYTFHSLLPGTHRLYIDPASLPADYIPAESMPLEVEVSDNTTKQNIQITPAAWISGRVVMYRFERNYGGWAGVDSGTDSPGGTGSEGTDEAGAAPGDTGSPDGTGGTNGTGVAGGTGSPGTATVAPDGTRGGASATTPSDVPSATSSGAPGAVYMDPQGISGVLLAVKGKDGTLRRALTGEDGDFIFPPLVPTEWTLEVPEDIVPEDHFLERQRFDLVLEPGQREEIVIKIFPSPRQIRFIDEGVVTEESPEENGSEGGPESPPKEAPEEMPLITE